MNNFFHIDFSDDLPKLTFKVKDCPIAKRWYKRLVDSTSSGKIRENNRLVNFNHDSKKEDLKELNSIILSMNDIWPESFPLIKKSSDLQQRLNDLHKLFEVYRGRIDNPPKFFKEASVETQNMLERMNVLIHQLEGTNDSPRLVVTFKDSPRIPLENDDYNYFTTIMKYGEVYINYCDTGRELIEAYVAKDNVVGKGNLRPLMFYSADFRVYFPENEVHLLPEHEVIAFNQFLEDNGFKVGDPQNSLGRIPVANLETDLEREDLIRLINKAGKIRRVFI